MFVLASNHFWKCFSINVGVWLRIKNKFSGNYFQLTMCFNGFDSEIGFSQNFHFKPFPDSRAKRERERETPVLKPSSSPTTTAVHSSDQAPIRRPQIELQSDDPHFTGLVDRSTVPIAPRRSSKDLLQRHSISPPPHDLVFASAA